MTKELGPLKTVDTSELMNALIQAGDKLANASVFIENANTNNIGIFANSSQKSEDNEAIAQLESLTEDTYALAEQIEIKEFGSTPDKSSSV